MSPCYAVVEYFLNDKELNKIMNLKTLIRDIPDFPKPGIMFRDITPLLKDPIGLEYVIDQIVHLYSQYKIDYVIGIESRGFMFATPLVAKMEAGFVPVRKPGKLPAQVYSVEYELEYGTDTLEIHQDAMPPGSRVLIVDDLIATGGTAAATANLVAQSGCELVGFAFVIELMDLKGRESLPAVMTHSLVQY